MSLDSNLMRGGTDTTNHTKSIETLYIFFPCKSCCAMWMSFAGSSCLTTLDIYHRHPYLLYNTGVELLFAGQPSAAFDRLLEAVKIFHTSPLLWLRLAEACIAVHRKVRCWQHY